MKASPNVTHEELDFVQFAQEVANTQHFSEQSRLLAEKEVSIAVLWSLAKNQQSENIWFAIIHNPRTPVDLLAWLATPQNTDAKMPLSYVKALAKMAHQSIDLEQAVFSWNEVVVDERLLTNKNISTQLVENLYQRDGRRIDKEKLFPSAFLHHPNCPSDVRLKLIDQCQQYLIKHHDHDEDRNKLLKVAAEWAEKTYSDVEPELLLLILRRLHRLPDEFVKAQLTHDEYLIRRAARQHLESNAVSYDAHISLADTLKDFLYHKIGLFSY